MLEGCFTTGSPTGLAREIQALHALARSGEIPTDVAERQLNSYLLAVGSRSPGVSPHLLVLPITDAPHHSLLPDLGYVVHRILSQNPLQCSLSGVLQHCLPTLRHAARPVTYEDSQDVLLNLVLALLLGLYPGGGVKKPCFEARAVLFTRLHGLLTASPEEQTLFCRGNHALVHLACMEYAARVLPANSPSQTAFIHERDPSTTVYFRRIPAVCDEFRQSLDTAEPPPWLEIRSIAHAAVERVVRLKKAGGPSHARDPAGLDPALLRPQANLAAYWTVPFLGGRPSPDEFRILGQGLGLAGPLIRHIQQEIQVFGLPGNLRRIQVEAISKAGIPGRAQTYTRTRHFLCQHCSLQHKSCLPPKLRLDTIRQALICSVCSSKDIISIDMVGRVLRHKRQSFVLCPGCVRVRQFKGHEEMRAWFLGSCQHSHVPGRSSNVKDRPVCMACPEPANQHQIERVDHLTGAMRPFFFCQRHMPRSDELARCLNARQLATRFCPDE